MQGAPCADHIGGSAILSPELAEVEVHLSAGRCNSQVSDEPEFVKVYFINIFFLFLMCVVCVCFVSLRFPFIFFDVLFSFM